MRAFFGAAFDDGFQDLKASVVLGILCALALIEIADLAEMVVGHRFNRLLVFVVSGSVGCAFTFLLNVAPEAKWRAFDERFGRMERKRHALCAMGLFVAMPVIVGGFFVLTEMARKLPK